MSNIRGWRTARLDELCDINPPKPKIQGFDEATEVLFVPMAAVDGVSGKVVNAEHSTVAAVGQKSYRSFTSGDVIFAKITPCMENGKAAVVPNIPTGLGFGSTEFHVLRPKPGVEPRLIWHLIRQKSFRDQATDHFTGTVGQLRVPAEFLKSFEASIPADEKAQSQIADLLDIATQSARSASSHLSIAHRVVERCRQAVLAAACSGRLTADWRQNHQISETATQYVAAIEAARTKRSGQWPKPTIELPTDIDLPEEWTWAPLGALVDIATGATPLRSRADYYGGPIPWVTSGAVNDGNITEAKQHITEIALSETNAKIFPPGTLLVAMYGEGQTRGRVAELGIAAATNQAVAALLFDEVSEPLREYLRLFLLENYERIRQLSFGGVQPNLSLTVIRGTLVPIPPLAEQIEIVHRVNQALATVATIQQRIAATMGLADRGSEAVVAKAFRGELLGAASPQREPRWS